MHYPTIIDIGTDEDAGEWLFAMQFASFPITDFPSPAHCVGHPDRRDTQPPVNVPAVFSHFHSSGDTDA